MATKSSLFRDASGRSYVIVFALVSTLFFLWGFCNGMIDTLNKQFQNSLHLTKTESAFVQFANYGGYFLMAIPAGLLARRFGYKGGILIGLGLVAAGALWFIPATFIDTFWAFLIGLVVLAAGLAILETIANPYATVLGAPESGATRINLAQSCNAIGVIFGPIVAGFFILSTTGTVNTSNGSLYLPYLIVGLLVSVLIVLFIITDVPDLHAMEEAAPGAAPAQAAPTLGLPLASRQHFIFAVVAQFLYVAAQVGIFTFFLNYLTSPDMPVLPAALAESFPKTWTALTPSGVYHITDFGSSALLSGAFILFLAGRLIGSALLAIHPAHLLLGNFAVANTGLMLLTVLPLGWLSFAALAGSFFFMSIMYPTIFALGIHGLGEHTKIGSSLIVMAIVGGALMPFGMGYIADHTGSMRLTFIIPLVCFAGVAAYGFLWRRLEDTDAGPVVVKSTGH